MFYYDEVTDDYFYWLLNIISNGHEDSYIQLLRQLFDTAFVYSLERDANRAHDGLDLRDKYLYEMDMDVEYSSPCSVLEMMVALAIRCEADVMYDPYIGDRTNVWFWLMIENLGLSDMNDRSYDRFKVKTTLIDFMNRNYDTDGKGSLFYVPGSKGMEREEIWYQMNTFLESILTNERTIE